MAADTPPVYQFCFNGNTDGVTMFRCNQGCHEEPMSQETHDRLARHVYAIAHDNFEDTCDIVQVDVMNTSGWVFRYAVRDANIVAVQQPQYLRPITCNSILFQGDSFSVRGPFSLMVESTPLPPDDTGIVVRKFTDDGAD